MDQKRYDEINAMDFEEYHDLSQEEYDEYDAMWLESPEGIADTKAKQARWAEEARLSKLAEEAHSAKHKHDRSLWKHLKSEDLLEDDESFADFNPGDYPDWRWDDEQEEWTEEPVEDDEEV